MFLVANTGGWVSVGQTGGEGQYPADLWQSLVWLTP